MPMTPETQKKHGANSHHTNASVYAKLFQESAQYLELTEQMHNSSN